MENEIQASGFVIQPRLQFKHKRDKMLYLLLLNEVNFIDLENGVIGQTTFILSHLAKETGWSRDILRGSLKRLSDAGYIKTETLYQNKGILVEIVDYKRLQKLENYKKNSEKDPQPKHKELTSNPQQKESSNTGGSRGESMEENCNPQRKHKETTSNTKISEFLPILINSINNNNINKTLKEYIADAPVKNKNLSTTEEIEIFVDFALRTNALPQGVNSKILISYFDCIRLTRSTCTISANILVKFIEKIQKYSVNQIHYALWKHVEQHDDKRESYTLGILRNIKEPEARRGLIKLKNKGVGIRAADQPILTAVGENSSSTRAEAQRLEELAKSKGFTDGTIRDPEFDF